MTSEKDAIKPKRGKRYDRAMKQAEVLSVTGGEPQTEPELWFLQRPDLVFPRDCAVPAFAPIRDLIEDRMLVTENFSSSLRKGARKRMKQLYRNLQGAYTKWNAAGGKGKLVVSGSRPPLLLITGPAKPKTFLREGIIEADPDILGLYRGLGDFAELRYLWLHGLDPDEEGWDQLRWGFPPHRRSTVDRMRIFRNPTVPVTQKQKLWSLLMSGQYAIDLDPDANPYDVVLEKGVQQGLEKGVQQGLEKGVQQGLEKGVEIGLEQGLRREFESLMMLASKVLDPEVVSMFEDQRVSVELVEKLRETLVRRLEE